VKLYEVPLKLFNRRWWWTTLLVIAGVIFLIRLGFWQLDRLEQRRAYNRLVAERWRQAPFDVNTHAIPTDLSELEYRRVQAVGEFDYTEQIALTGQTRDGAPGVVLVTPLMLDDSRAVLVARGWIPYAQSKPEEWSQFEEPPGAPVIGLIQESQLLPNGSPPSVPDSPQVEWFRINIDAIQPQLPYTLLPVFILQLPEDDRAYDALPFREEPLRLDEGSHFSYAIQWFTFALMLGGGYLFFIQSQELRAQRIAGTLEPPAEQPAEDADSGLSGLPPQEGHA
jgi:surfeit locus 1 family protein